MKKGVIYTCLIGNYDFLKHFPVLEKDWDYVCFTDLNIKDDPQWQIRPISFNKLDSARNYRWYKTHPHILFPEYKQSLFIDANIYIKSHFIFEQINKNPTANIILAKHFKNNCIYQEYEDCKKNNKDNLITMKNQINLIKHDNFPINFGFSEANIIYRQHNNEKIKKAMEDWWWWIENYSKRDQLSLQYVLWKNEIYPSYFSSKSPRRMPDDFLIISHNDELLDFLSKREEEREKLIKQSLKLEKIESSKFFKLWPIYNKIKKIFKQNG